MTKKRLGIIGGMGPVAGAYVFKRLVELTPALTDQDYVETFLHNNTCVPDRTKGILHGGPSPLPELIRSAELLDNLGADYLILACMTSHHFVPELQTHARATIIDAIAETVSYTTDHLPDVRSVGILATTGNLRMELFQRKYAAAGISSVLFDDADQVRHFMDPVYAEWGIKAGNITGLARERVLAGALRLIELGADAIVSGCTEIPLVLTQNDLPVPLIDTVDVLVGAAIARCLGVNARTVLTPSPVVKR